MRAACAAHFAAVVSVRGLTGLLLATAALLVVTGAAAAPPPVPGERAALAAVKHAVAEGRLTRAAAKVDRAEIAGVVPTVKWTVSVRHSPGGGGHGPSRAARPAS